jgi:predicted ABC-type transport system involved in lysophospholipase L1 biosynthesis ATPase subunit
VDLDVARHEVICLIGASGSGKSTLLRCVNLLERIDAGTIWLDGQAITRPGVDENAVRRHIGIVFQSFNLFPHMTVERNVTLAPMKVLGLSRAEAASQAAELLDRFGDQILVCSPHEETWLENMRDHGQRVYMSSAAPYLYQTPGWQPMREFWFTGRDGRRSLFDASQPRRHRFHAFIVG